MNFIAFRTLTSTFRASGLFLALALTIGAARAQDKTYVMKITAPTLNASPDAYARSYGAAVEKESGGRIKAEVYPASQLGSIPRRSKVRSSVPSSVRSFRRSSSSGSTSALKC